MTEEENKNPELEEAPEDYNEEELKKGGISVPWGWAIAMGVIALLMVACIIVIVSL